MNNPEGLSNCQQPVNVYTPTCGHTEVCPYRLNDIYAIRRGKNTSTLLYIDTANIFNRIVI